MNKLHFDVANNILKLDGFNLPILVLLNNDSYGSLDPFFNVEFSFIVINVGLLKG